MCGLGHSVTFPKCFGRACAKAKHTNTTPSSICHNLPFQNFRTNLRLITYVWDFSFENLRLALYHWVFLFGLVGLGLFDTFWGCSFYECWIGMRHLRWRLPGVANTPLDPWFPGFLNPNSVRGGRGIVQQFHPFSDSSVGAWFHVSPSSNEGGIVQRFPPSHLRVFREK